MSLTDRGHDDDPEPVRARERRADPEALGRRGGRGECSAPGWSQPGNDWVGKRVMTKLGQAAHEPALAEQRETRDPLTSSHDVRQPFQPDLRPKPFAASLSHRPLAAIPLARRLLENHSMIRSPST